MDTISSRETNTNFLPMAGIIVGAVALIISIVALVKLSSVSKEVAECRGLSAQVEGLNSQVAQLGQVAQAANDAKQMAAEASNYGKALNKLTQDALNQVGTEIAGIKTRLDARPAPGPAGGRGPVVAGPGEYVVVAGDSSGTVIAHKNGVSLQALMAVNPGVNWNKLHIGQKLKLPAKAGAQPAAAQQTPPRQ